MSRPEAKWTSTAGSATVFGLREMLSGESRLSLLHLDRRAVPPNVGIALAVLYILTCGPPDGGQGRERY